MTNYLENGRNMNRKEMPWEMAWELQIYKEVDH